jgi:hypothetical protein
MTRTIFKNYWSYLLLTLIVLDSIITHFVGTEQNIIILFAMNKLHLSLGQAMILRVIYCLPFVFILDRLAEKLTPLCFGLYLFLYLFFILKP